MEPLSTFALVAAFLVPAPLTRRPEWTVPARELETTAAPTLDTDQPLLASFAATEKLIAPKATGIRPDRKMMLAAEVQEYMGLVDGWDGAGSLKPTVDAGYAAQYFIDQYPAGLPLPKPMVSSAGHLGFYWDLENGYADLNFDAAGRASFFSRHSDGTEHFEDGLALIALSRAWVFSSVGALAAPALKAA